MRRTILLADDSPTIRRLVTHTFADGNFEIVEASDGDAAIRMLDEVRPSVVLTDIYMPGRNGYEVCAFVRKHPTLGSTPVVLLVGAFDAFDEEMAEASGAAGYIQKPFEPQALIDLVMSILQPESPESEESAGESNEAVQAEPPLKAAVPAAAPAPVPAARQAAPPPPRPPAPEPEEPEEPDEADLLGLEDIFRDEPVPGIASAGTMTDEEIDRIADRVIQRLSSQVIESIAWDIVPDITEKIVREELKRIDES